MGYAGEVTCVRFAFARDDLIIAGDDQGWLYLHRLENSSVSTTRRVFAVSDLVAVATCCKSTSPLAQYRGFV